MRVPELLTLLDSLERKVGPLSPIQRILLGTDGSMTGLLEIVTRGPVDITTRVQEIVSADDATARLLEVERGEDVNYRVVELRSRLSGTALIYAISHTPLSRLDPAFRSDLMKADIPIGKILRSHHIESRREILDLSVQPADGELSAVFGICAGEPVLTRHYHIIREKKPLISIQEFLPASRFTADRRIVVEAPARLHLSLIDLNGSIGRVDGGIGITLAQPVTLLEACWGDTLRVQGGDASARDRVHRVATAMLPLLGRSGATITLHRTIPAHTGLGSGTSLSLATAAALYRLAGRTEETRALAVLVGRGGTSGIGTAAFEAGGFLIDGGHRFGEGKEKSTFLPSAAAEGITPAPLIVRHPFPEDWKVLLALPETIPGASGREERDIFQTACPVPLSDVQEICHEVLLRMLPGLAEHDLDSFGVAVNRIQERGFKKLEIARQAPLVPRILSALRDAGAACAGMSSFGPTVFAITDTDTDLLESAAREAMSVTGGKIMKTGGRNQGATIRLEEGRDNIPSSPH
ncbi:MAG: chorismate pyruvate-lyase family protein [Methanomicrobiales archaeon]|nr:chorismate pyruvate-lyase family protein [Methanomicrobiales archaeon]